MIKIYNTLTRKKEKLCPLMNKITVYVCGMTVYDMCHIGHARTFIIFDIIIRYLKYCNYSVEYVRNITDIDDKIIQKSYKNKENFVIFVEKMIKEMHIDFNSMNMIIPTHEPRVTENIPLIIKLIKILLDKKHAYQALNGDILFSVNSYSNYGDLSNQNMNFLQKINTYNLEKNKYKLNITDFVLWKTSKKGEPSWESPWGLGRPGWHIECSAMNNKYFNFNVNIHGGGRDLIFPHHENEIAQSMCINNNIKNTIWIHTGLVLNNKNIKMSKSLNNFFTIRDSLKYFNSDIIRYFCTFSHYRSDIQYHTESFQQAQIFLNKLYTIINDFDSTSIIIDYSDEEKYFIKNFENAMNDDFNTPKAYAVITKLANYINISKKNTINSKKTNNLISILKKLANILGLLTYSQETFFHYGITEEKKNKIEKLIQLRNKARINKRWNVADFIRIKLHKMGVDVEDNALNTQWKKNFRI